MYGIFRVGPGFPDCVRTCLLHQKLQMINCCIGRKKAREDAERRELGMDIGNNDSGDGDSDEDEFFECLNEDPSEVNRHAPWNRPVGRLSRHPNLRLVSTGEPLYLPVTQDPVPKTEDQLEEDAQVMMQLGTDKTGSEMRARLMSASLLSDMESFKAANPSGQLEDFIRWYSPRDWIEDESGALDAWGQRQGQLSPRMQLANNPWASTWESARPVAAHRQKRLFDDTREAEKVLHYLGSRRVGQLAQLLLPTLSHAALVALHERTAKCTAAALPALPDVLNAIHSRLQIATKPVTHKLQLYEDIVRDIENVETLITQVNSLQLKLMDGDVDSGDKDLTSFLIQLMRGREVSVPSGSRGSIGARITKMFFDAQKNAQMMTSSSSETDVAAEGKFKPFPTPTSKEFILRAVVPRPSPSSTPQPQRLYVRLKRDSIRMAGAFSEDTVFF
ncbi:hypothetical protein QAD02_016730 [Eretmocerus hayati]|uniref:Uncharacterized protein n=1 Tax=Eretmocerus hayati TaxID=131215 RepID=A0ACC2PCY0_9HYME|nr:hypothetical protein QAD02_016730 [Eretmocerus hayati]